MAVNVSGRLLAGRYRVERRIGSGGMGAVYLALDERLGRQVAVKRLPADSPEEAARRFEREARLGASLNHPNLVTVYDTDTDQDGVLIVMEYVAGATLAGELSAGPMAPERALEVVGGVAEALDYAHDAGVVHRDIKPANVLLGQGTVKLADLGIATAAEQSDITRTGSVLGTPSYMAAEQLEGRPIGPAVDVYALATVAFECLCGCKARTGRTPIEIARKVASEPPPDLRDSWAEVPPQVAAALRKGMSRDPDERPKSAGALFRELREGLSAAATESTRAMTRTRAAAAGPGRSGPGLPGPRGRPAPRPRAAEPAPARPAPTFTPYSSGRSSSGRWLAALAAVVVALAAIGLVVWGAGGEDGSGERAGESGSGAPSTDSPTGGTEPAPGGDPSASGEGGETAGPPPGGYDAELGARLNDQGFALSQRGDDDAAVPILRRAVAAFPPDSDGGSASDGSPYAFALFNLGHSLRETGSPAEAIPYLERRLEVSDFKRGTVQGELALARQEASEE
jgi:serine/threonine-protein kinase